MAAQQLWAALITAVATVTRTISIAVEVVEFTVAAQSSQAALLFAAEPPFAEVARVLPAAEAEELAASSAHSPARIGRSAQPSRA